MTRPRSEGNPKSQWQAKSLRSTFGNQCISSLQTSPSCGFGSSLRDASARVSACRQHMSALMYRSLHVPVVCMVCSIVLQTVSHTLHAMPTYKNVQTLLQHMHQHIGGASTAIGYYPSYPASSLELKHCLAKQMVPRVLKGPQCTVCAWQAARTESTWAKHLRNGSDLTTRMIMEQMQNGKGREGLLWYWSCIPRQREETYRDLNIFHGIGSCPGVHSVWVQLRTGR